MFHSRLAVAHHVIKCLFRYQQKSLLKLRDMLIKAIREVVSRAFFKKGLVCGSGSLWPNQLLDLVPELCRRGGVIQGVPQEVVVFPSIHAKIGLDDSVGVLGTSETVFSQNFEPVACMFPHLDVMTSASSTEGVGAGGGEHQVGGCAQSLLGGGGILAGGGSRGAGGGYNYPSASPTKPTVASTAHAAQQAGSKQTAPAPPTNTLAPFIAETFAQKIGTVLAEKSIFGHCSIDLVGYRNPKYDPEERQRITAQREDPECNVFGALKSPEPPSTPASSSAAPSDTKNPSPPSGNGTGWPSSSLAGSATASAAASTPNSLLLQLNDNEFRSAVVGPITTAGGNTATHPLAFHVVDVDVRLTDAAAGLQTFQFLSQTALDARSGRFFLRPDSSSYDAAHPELNERVGLLVHPHECPGLSRYNHAQVFSYLKSKKITYDLLRNCGAIFLQLDLVHEQIGFLCIERNHRLVIEKTKVTLEALHQIALQHAGRGEPDRRGEDAVPHIREIVGAIRAVRKRWGMAGA